MSQTSSGAAASIGSIFSHPRNLESGAQLVDATSDGINHRVKCLFTEVLTVPALVEALHRLADLTRNLDVSRAAFRFLVGHDFDVDALEAFGEAPGWKSGTRLQFEGFMPVIGHPTVSGVAYFGAVTPERCPSQSTMSAEGLLRTTANSACARKRFDTEGTERLTAPSTADIMRLVELYSSAFEAYLVGFTPQSVEAMVRSGITFVVRDEHGVIQSIALAEEVFLEPSVGPMIPFYEVSEVATDPAYRGRGFAHRLYCAVIGAILAKPAEVLPVIFTEIRAAWYPLHAIMVKTGFAQIGYTPAHCAIKSAGAESVPQTGIFGNLAICVYEYAD